MSDQSDPAEASDEFGASPRICSDLSDTPDEQDGPSLSALHVSEPSGSTVQQSDRQRASRRAVANAFEQSRLDTRTARIAHLMNRSEQIAGKQPDSEASDFGDLQTSMERLRRVRY